jgi:hypothetical protein
MNMKKLQLDGKHLTADIIAVIHKLGDPEQQELIHGETNHKPLVHCKGSNCQHIHCHLIKETFYLIKYSDRLSPAFTEIMLGS